MRSISALFSPFSNLAASGNALAGIVDTVSGRLRQQLAIDCDAAPALPHGEVIDGGVVPSTKRGRKAS